MAIAIGCGLEDVSIIATIKSNYGKIFERTDKSPYTDIFNARYSTSYIWNNIQIYRNFEWINIDYQKKESGTNRLISIHGNRFLLHIFLCSFRETIDLNATFLSNERMACIKDSITDKLPLIIEELISIKKQEFPDAYPANIFKNGNRCKQMLKLLKETDAYQSIIKQGALV
jgi:hypothetical protein